MIIDNTCDLVITLLECFVDTHMFNSKNYFAAYFGYFNNVLALPPPLRSHRGSHPADSVGLGGPRSELVEPQGRRGALEQAVLEQPPAPEALGSQGLVILTQELHRVVVLPEAFVAIPLAPQPGGHARGVNALLHHPELAELTVKGSTVALRWNFLYVWNYNKMLGCASN